MIKTHYGKDFYECAKRVIDGTVTDMFDRRAKLIFDNEDVPEIWALNISIAYVDPKGIDTTFVDFDYNISDSDVFDIIGKNGIVKAIGIVCEKWFDSVVIRMTNSYKK